MDTETKNDVHGLFIQKERREKEFWFIRDQIWNIVDTQKIYNSWRQQITSKRTKARRFNRNDFQDVI